MVKALIPYTAPPKILTNIPSDLMFHIQACKLRLFHMKTMQNRLFIAIKFFKRNLLSVEYGITEMRDPVSRVDIVAVGFEFKIERQMAMAKNEIIHVVFFQDIPAINNDFFFVVSQIAPRLDLSVSFQSGMG